MKKIVALGLALTLALSANHVFAQSRYVYDPQSGSSYTVTPGFSGGAHIRGFNLNTGSIWNTDILQQGSWAIPIA
jgi:hypothetical protein